MAQAQTSEPDEQLAGDIVRLLQALVRSPGPHESVQVRRLLPDKSDGYAWTGRPHPYPPRVRRPSER